MGHYLVYFCHLLFLVHMGASAASNSLFTRQAESHLDEASWNDKATVVENVKYGKYII